MKTAIKVLSRGGIVIAITGTLQFTALIAYLNLVLNLNTEKLRIIIKYGLPSATVLLALFAISIPVAGKWLMSFLLRYEKGAKFTDDELITTQKKLTNFPYWVALLSCVFWIIAIPIAIFPAKSALNWNMTDIFFGSMGGFIGGVLNMPVSVYATNVIGLAVMQITLDLSPNIPRGGKMGFNLPLSWKISLAFVIMIWGLISYVGLVGYARIVRFPHEEVIGGLFLNFMLLSGAILLLTVLLAILAARDITTMLGRLKRTAHRIAEGVFDERAEVISNDEIGELAAVVNIMAENLHQNRKFRENLQIELDSMATDMSDAARSILDVAKEQSTNATEQAVAIKQVAATHEMILENAKQVVSSARESDRAAAEVLSSTDEGIRRSAQTLTGIETLQSKVSEIGKAMAEVESCAKKVNEALRAIDDIAERSNLLSLNASLEAATSGEKGQRFSVVAQQIKQLADKSRTSSGKIRMLMDEISATTALTVEHINSGRESAFIGVELTRDISAEFNRANNVAGSSSQLARTIDLTTRQQQTSLEQASATLKQVVQSAENVLEGSRLTETELTRIEKLSQRIKSTISRLEYPIVSASAGN